MEHKFLDINATGTCVGYKQAYIKYSFTICIISTETASLCNKITTKVSFIPYEYALTFSLFPHGIVTLICNSKYMGWKLTNMPFSVICHYWSIIESFNYIIRIYCTQYWSNVGLKRKGCLKSVYLIISKLKHHWVKKRRMHVYYK